MPITIKKNAVKFRELGAQQFMGINAIAETSTSELISMIETAGQAQIAAINDLVPQNFSQSYIDLINNVTELKRSADLFFDTSNITLNSSNKYNGTIVASGKIQAASYARTTFAQITGAKNVIVRKKSGKTFTIGFANTSNVVNNTPITNIQFDSLGTIIVASVPNGAKWLCINYWNTNTSRDGSDPEKEEEMRQSIEIKASTSFIKPQYVTPEIFGAKGDGLTDDSYPLQSACDFASFLAIPVILKQTYAITKTINVRGKILGFGTIKLLDQNTRLLGNFFNTISDTYIDGITFDCKSMQDMTLEDKSTHYNIGLYHSGGQLIIKNCIFKNLYRTFIALADHTITNVNISNNLFDATNKTNRYFSSCISISNATSDNMVLNIVNNEFRGYVGEDDDQDNACAIYVANSNPKQLLIDKNTIINMGRLGTNIVNGVTKPGNSRLCAIDFYFNVKNAIISNNKLLNCNWVPMRIHGAQNVAIIKNEISIKNRLTEPLIWVSDSPSSAQDSPIGTNSIIISQNIINCDGKHASSVFQVNSVPRDTNTASSITGIIIKDNIVKNTRAENVFKFDDSLKQCIIEDNAIIMLPPSGNNVTDITNGIIFMALNNHTNDYSETSLIINNNNIKTKQDVINLTNCDNPSSIKIINNILESTVGTCIDSIDNTRNVFAINNILYGNSDIKNTAKAINNISFCTSQNYIDNAEDLGNYPSN